MALTTFYFSRYHFEIDLTPEDKLKHLTNGLRNIGSIVSYNFKYKFGKVQQVNEDGRVAIVGTLIKYDPLANTESVNEETGEIEENLSSNKVVAKAKFVIQPGSSQIAYASVTNHISKRTFAEVFIKLVSKNNGYEDKKKIISISEINEVYSFVKKVEAVKKVKKITIRVVPSNPHYSEDWESIDEDLKARNIDVYKEVQESKSEDGIVVDEETKAKFKMSEDGYGETVVQGENEFGKTITLSTRQRDRQESESIDIEDSIKPDNLVRKLWTKFTAIVSRAKDGTN